MMLYVVANVNIDAWTTYVVLVTGVCLREETKRHSDACRVERRRETIPLRLKANLLQALVLQSKQR